MFIKINNSFLLVQQITLRGFMICMKDLQPFKDHHDPVNISYLAIGGMSTPCIFTSLFNVSRSEAPQTFSFIWIHRIIVDNTEVN